MKLFAPLALFYVALVVAANWLASKYTITVPFTNLVAPAGVLCVGAVLVMRDWVQQLATVGFRAGDTESDRRGIFVALSLIVVAGLISLASGFLFGYSSLVRVALASLAAFAISEGIFETAIFTPLRKKYLTVGVGLSATVGNAVDSFVFIWLAWAAIKFPGATHWGLFKGNFVGKLEMIALGVAVTAARRIVFPVAKPA